MAIEDKKFFPRRPPKPVDVKLNGPHKAYRDLPCEKIGCGNMIMQNESFYYVLEKGMEKGSKYCRDCTKATII